MSDAGGGILEPLRRPEYTGENRCTPCTVVNALLAVLASVALGAVWLPAGVLALAVSAAAIYLRGYLMPYTPTLTARYLPDRVLAAFDKGAAGEASAGSEPAADDVEWETLERLADHRENAVDVDAFLREEGITAGAGVDGEGVEGASGLTDRFAGRLDAAAGEPSAVTDGALADFLRADPAEVERRPGEPVEVKVRHRVRTWPSAAALAADLTTHRVLSEWTDRWGTVPVDQRVEIAEGLRSGYTDCPACGGELRETEGAVESCCRVIDVIALVCGDCGDHLREFDPDAVPTRLRR